MNNPSTKTSRNSVTASGDLTESTVPALRQELAAVLGDGAREITLDVAHVRLMDAAGVALLCAACNSLKRIGGALTLVNVSPEIGILLRQTGVSRHLSITPSA